MCSLSLFSFYLETATGDVYENIRMETSVLESLFNKAAGLQVCKLIKKRPQHRYFPAIIAKFLRRPILKNICERLLLFIQKIC